MKSENCTITLSKSARDKAKLQAIKEKMTMQKWIEKTIETACNSEFNIIHKEYLNNYYRDNLNIKDSIDCKELEE